MTKLNGFGLMALAGLAACQVFGASAHSLVVGEGFVDPVGFYDPAPTFSWKLPAGVKRQTAHHIEVRDVQRQAVLWDSGWAESDQSVFVPYGGNPLVSRQQVEWRIRFRDENGKASDWSAPARCEMGLLSADEWTARWIRPEAVAPPEQEAVALLRCEFNVNEKIKQARLYVTARGVFEVRLNGEKVGNDHFANGWTAYKKRIDTLTYDVTGQLYSGSNAVAAMIGGGWYCGSIGWIHDRSLRELRPELLLQLEILYEDGSLQTLVSDGTWKGVLDDRIISSSIYNGETCDASGEMPGWDRPDFNDEYWGPVVAKGDLGSARLSPKPFAPVRATETLSVKKITEPEPGCFVFDLGQNMVGWARLNIPVERDRTVKIRVAEMLNKDGTLYTENYRGARSTDYYTPSGNGTVEWEPVFTFHGFRYVELSGLPENAQPRKDWVEGVVLHSDLRKVGMFESSHEKLNRLQSNIVWGQRGNFVDIPPDCPQRDERLGWTGDAQVFCPTSMFNYDCHAFWKSWLGSMRDEQLPDGRIPNVIPDRVGENDSPGWVDAATIIPWAVYVRTGDTEILADNFRMMEKLVEWYRSHADDHIVEGVGAFGDWLQPYAEHAPGDTSWPLLATAFYANSVQILADSAEVLGKTIEASRYANEAKKIKRAYSKHFFGAEGRLKNVPETQTAYLLSIAFDLIPAEQQERAARHLVRLVHEADGHLRTGFLGTPYIASVLDRTGHADLAYTVLFKETYPSWFYSINQGGHHHVGAVEQLQPWGRLWRCEHELLQPLCLWCDRTVDVRTHRRTRTRSRKPRLQAFLCATGQKPATVSAGSYRYNL